MGALFSRQTLRWPECLGSMLLAKGMGPTKVEEVISGKKLIGIYFSAHWCPPCRGFTPILAEFYDMLKDVDNDALEIVFVSSDNNQEAFDEYYSTMPWSAVPFNESNVRRALGGQFSVGGIPTFIVVDARDGSIKDSNGRATVAGCKGDCKKALAKWGIA
jgi:nucleoredoxin